MYIRSVINSPIKSDLSCHVYGVYISCLVYVDDIVFMSASVAHLQRMMDICSEQGSSVHCAKNETCIILNILYNCTFIAMKFSLLYPDDLSY